MSGLAPIQRARLDLGFARRGDRTILDRRHFSWPFVLTRTFRLDPVPAHMLTVIVQTSSGAVHGEDRLTQRFAVGEGSAVHLTTQGATAIHRADHGMIAEESVQIVVEKDAFLEYLPEPRILFPGAALRQTLDVVCAPGATAVVADAFTFHDPDGCGGMFRQLDQTVTIRRVAGDPLVIDRLNLTRGLRGRLAAFRAFGALFVIRELPAEMLQFRARELVRAFADVPGLYVSTSLLPNDAGIGVRFAGRDMRSLRSGLDRAWVEVRRQFCDHPPASRRKAE